MRIDRLTAAMRRQGYNQSTLAKEIGITHGAMWQIIEGRTKKTKHLPEIARALGVSIDWLLGTGGAAEFPMPSRDAYTSVTPLVLPIADAPAGDGWIMAHVPDRLAGKHPWVPVTRCDGGWSDEDGYLVEPTRFFLLPDPQPAPTGWRPAEGVIRIIRAASADIPWLRYLVEVVGLDGDADDTREPDMARDIEDAERRAARMAAKLRLPIIWADDANVIPFVGPRR